MLTITNEARLLVSVPLPDRLSDSFNVYVIILPPNLSADEIVHPNYYLSVDGRDVTIFPRHLREWYEQAIARPSKVSTELDVHISWPESPALNEARPIRWHKNGFGCAVFQIKDEALLSRELMVSVFAGPLIVAHATLPLADPRIYEGSLYGRWIPNAQQVCDLYFRFDSTGNYIQRIFGLFNVYHRIFASYAREDLAIVEAVSSVMSLLHNIDLVWDLSILRSGDTWQAEIQQEIKRADSFQLFWSDTARESENVEAEWRYALSLNRTRFINPVFWYQPMPTPPKELSHLHFAFMQFPNVNSQ